MQIVTIQYCDNNNLIVHSFNFLSEIDLLPLCSTFFLSLVLGVEYGTIIGIGVDMMLLLYPMAKPGYEVCQNICPYA